MSIQPLYEFSDGNANLYSLKGTTLYYRPVKPEESSTGAYSGGDSKTVQLSQANADSIRMLMDKAMINKEVQIENRVKGSGLIRIEGKGNCIIVYGCEEIKSIEAALKENLNN